MRLAVLLAAAACLAPSPVPAAEPASGSLSLLADFVELGRMDRSLPRDLAMVELLNLSPHVLDVSVGEGTATLKPDERLIARVAAGDRDLKVRTREPNIPSMDGRLHLEAGVRYELALGWGEAPPVAAPIATPGVDATSGADVAPAPATASPSEKPKAAERRERRTKSGKVDIGRRRQ